MLKSKDEIVYFHKDLAAGRWAEMPFHLKMDPVKLQRYYDGFVWGRR